MKKVVIIFTDSKLVDKLRKRVVLDLPDDANFIQAVKKISDTTEDKFPMADYPEYHSLLHMIWNPIGKRVYEQIGTSAYYGDRQFFDIRKKPYDPLPDGLVIFLGTGLCKTEAEEIVDYQEFKEAMSK